MIIQLYDEYALKPGDSSSESIDKGIKECKKCILIISPNFIANDGWTQKEFKSIVTKEMIEKQKVIIPIWVNVTPKDVYDYDAALADTFAINWNKGTDSVCNQLASVLG